MKRSGLPEEFEVIFMDYRKLADSIKRHIGNKPEDHAAYIDLLSLCRQWEAEDFQAAHEVSKELRVLSAKQLRRTSPKEAEHFYEAWRKSLLFDAPHNFDAFMTYIELDRKPEKRFYAPRRHYLKPMVQGFQDILDKKLRLLTIIQIHCAGLADAGGGDGIARVGHVVLHMVPDGKGGAFIGQQCFRKGGGFPAAKADR